MSVEKSESRIARWLAVGSILALILGLVFVVLEVRVNGSPVRSGIGEDVTRPSFQEANSSDVSVPSVDWLHCTREVHAVGSDLWVNTWADDNNVYAAWGDGWGFDSDPASDPKKSYGFSMLTGTVDSWTGADVHYGPNDDGNGKITGLLSLSGTLYALREEQDAVVTVTLLKSTDDGVNWSSVFTFTRPAGKQDVHFLQNGQDYSGNTDGFVYASWDSTDNAIDWSLYRVAIADIETKASWEVYTGTPGSPSWAQAFVGNTEGSVADLPGVPAIVYFPAPVDKYIVTAITGQGVGEWAIYESDEPWGPYTTIASYTNWCGFDGTDGGGSFLNKFVVPKWIDGLDFSILTSSRDGTLTWDAFVKVDGTLASEFLSSSMSTDPRPVHDF